MLFTLLMLVLTIGTLLLSFNIYNLKIFSALHFLISLWYTKVGLSKYDPSECALVVWPQVREFFKVVSDFT